MRTSYAATIHDCNKKINSQKVHVTVMDSCCITRSHVFLLFFTFYYWLSIRV